MAIKYQQRIHKAFADELSSDAKEQLESAIEQFPTLKDKLSEIDFMSDDAAAIATSNPFLCEHFAVKSDDADAFDFDTPHLKSVKQTVKVNVTYYRNLLQFIKDEKDDVYSKLYTDILKKMDDYFAQAAEDILADVYGEQYTTFFDAKTAEFAEKAKNNRPNKKNDSTNEPA